jgi:hypothetical protein
MFKWIGNYLELFVVVLMLIFLLMFDNFVRYVMLII